MATIPIQRYTFQYSLWHLKRAESRSSVVPRYLPLDFIILSQNNHNNFITSQDTEKFVILILKIIPETVSDGSFRVFFVQILRKEGTFVSVQKGLVNVH